MPIVPDDKDWTWVLDRPCPECGFDASTTQTADIAGLIRANAATWPPLLADPRARTRPDDATWSGIEYACHVRDVLRLYEQRLTWMLEQDDLERIIVGMQLGVLVIASVSDGSQIGVVARVGADIGAIGYQMTVLVERAGTMLTPVPQIRCVAFASCVAATPMRSR